MKGGHLLQAIWYNQSQLNTALRVVTVASSLAVLCELLMAVTDIA